MYEVEAIRVEDHGLNFERDFTQKLSASGLCYWLLLQEKEGETTPIKVISFRRVKPEFQEVSQFDFFKK